MMISNHGILKLLREIIIQKDVLKLEYKNIEEIISSMKIILDTKENFNSVYLLNYFYQNISDNNVSKRKTTARDL